MFDETRLERSEQPPELPTTVRGFLDAIIASPEDDAARQIYADWLMAQDDPRGEFIAVQCELARLETLAAKDKATKERVGSLRTRSEALLAKHKKTWTTPLRAGSIESTIGGRKSKRGNPTHWTFSRGFVDTLTMNVDDFGVAGAKILAHEPVRVVRLTGLQWAEDASFVDFEGAEHLRGLDLSGNRVPMDVAADLGAKPLTSLERLSVNDCRMGSRVLKKILPASPELWPALRELDLGFNEFKDAGAKTLAKWKGTPRLRHIDLAWTGLRMAGLKALTSLSLAVEDIVLDFNGELGRAGAELLAKAQWPALKRLSAKQCNMTKADLTPLRERGVKVVLQ